MQVLYDDDAVYFTAWLQRQLIRAGFLESAADCEVVLQQLEEGLNFTSGVEKLYERNDLVEAMRRILWAMDEADIQRLVDLADPFDSFPFPFWFFFPVPLNRYFGNIDEATEFFRSRTENINGRLRAEYWRFIRVAASVLQEKEYRTLVPLNVVAAISVLHQLIVIPKLSFDRLGNRMQQFLRSEVAVVDVDGTVVLDRSIAESMDAEVRDFWKLFETVEKEFAEAFADTQSQEDAKLSVGQATYQLLEDVVERQARGIAKTVMDRIRQNRGEA